MIVLMTNNVKVIKNKKDMIYLHVGKQHKLIKKENKKEIHKLRSRKIEKCINIMNQKWICIEKFINLLAVHKMQKRVLHLNCNS